MNNVLSINDLKRVETNTIMDFVKQGYVINSTYQNNGFPSVILHEYDKGDAINIYVQYTRERDKNGNFIYNLIVQSGVIMDGWTDWRNNISVKEFKVER